MLLSPRRRAKQRLAFPEKLIPRRLPSVLVRQVVRREPLPLTVLTVYLSRAIHFLDFGNPSACPAHGLTSPAWRRAKNFSWAQVS